MAHELDDLVTVNSISLQGAERAVAAARAEAVRKGLEVSIAVLDRGGYLVSFCRMDGIHPGTVAVAIAKAKCAILYNRPTQTLAAALDKGGLSLLSLPDLVPLPGGIPMTNEGGVVGAIGVSGAAPQDDEEVARAGSEFRAVQTGA